MLLHVSMDGDATSLGHGLSSLRPAVESARPREAIIKVKASLRQAILSRFADVKASTESRDAFGSVVGLGLAVLP